MKNLVFCVCIALFFAIGSMADPSLWPNYYPRGVGGGGAMAGFSISPFSDLYFVGTDMGTLFRSTDRGTSWVPLSHAQVRFDSDLSVASEVGFSSDPQVVFFAEGGLNPKRSKDSGVTWSSIAIPLDLDERILYWVGDPSDGKLILCATTQGLWRSVDQGDHWTPVSEISGASLGTSWLSNSKKRIFHATPKTIFVSDDQGMTFTAWHSPKAGIRKFAAGQDSRATTFAYIDLNGKEACAWANDAEDSSEEQKVKTINECGYVWIMTASEFSDEIEFKKTNQIGGRFLKMADNDSQTIYVTGGDWVRQYGSKVWVSQNAGNTFELRLQINDWDQHPYQPWPSDKLEYSAVGLDVGWYDNAPFSFAVNRLKSSEAGESGNYFLHTTSDAGLHWKAPFTQFADAGERTSGKRWKSTGLEVTSVLKMKFHPRSSKLAYAGLSDIGGYVTEDGGKTFRISKAKYNTNYDYAFDPSRLNRVYTASGDSHDFPVNIQMPIQSEGGIFVSDDRGHTWNRLTPETSEFNRQFLSVAYDPIHRILYGGSQGGGVARSKDNGVTWEFQNKGFPLGDVVIPQIEIDPLDGTVYALLTGESPSFWNREKTGIYRLDRREGKEEWTLLRTEVVRPEGLDEEVELWQFPTSFAIDLSDRKRKTFWLSDMEQKGGWMATGIWKTTDAGDAWKRSIQLTHAMSVSIDPRHPQTIYASGLYDVSGDWGNGGAFSSNDGGITWRKNGQLSLLSNLCGFTPDPNSATNGFFLFFGGGILYGPIQAPVP